MYTNYIILKGAAALTTSCHSDALVGAVATLCDLSISNKGVVTIDGIKDTITYDMKSWTKEEAIEHFCQTRIMHVIKIEIYRATKL